MRTDEQVTRVYVWNGRVGSSLFQNGKASPRLSHVNGNLENNLQYNSLYRRTRIEELHIDSVSQNSHLSRKERVNYDHI